MSKYVGPILIGFVVALVVSGGLGFLLSMTPEPHFGLAMWPGVFIGAFTAFILSNLAGNRSIKNATDDERRLALARTPPAGKALLYFYREGFVAKLAGMDITIDGKPVAQLKSPRFTVVAIPAGPHAVTVKLGGLAGAQSKVGETSIDAPADGAVAIRITMAMGLVQGSIVLTTQTDMAAARLVMGTMPMTPPDVAEL